MQLNCHHDDGKEDSQHNQEVTNQLVSSSEMGLRTGGLYQSRRATEKRVRASVDDLGDLIQEYFDRW